MNSYRFEDKTIDIFIKRSALDEGIEEKAIRKHQDRIEKKMSKLIEEETRFVDIRYFHELNEKLKDVNKGLAKDFVKFRKKNPLAFYKWTDDVKKSFEEIYHFFSNIQKNFTVQIANLDKDFSDDDYRGIYLYSQGLNFVKESFLEIKKAIQLEQYRRTATKITYILNAYTAIIMIILRLIEIEKHWDKLDNEEKKYLEELLFFDLNTLENYSSPLPSKKERYKTKRKVDKELLQMLFT